MEFILGCNYWASNAGADMWRNYDFETIKKDLEVLSGYGVKYLRVFPNWRDFQPVAPVYKGQSILKAFCLEGDREPQNPYYLDEEMLDRFEAFASECGKYGIKLVVGLITGWMSGRMYIPTAFYNKNVITDPQCLYFEQLFITGFVSRFKNNPAIYAWDLGNECNCMAEADKWHACCWAATIANAIKAADGTHLVISGMHGLTANSGEAWHIKEQSLLTDMLTTHPYPLFCDNAFKTPHMSVRTNSFATAQTKYYAEVGRKPCMAEEVGTLNLCNDENSARYLRMNMFSLWANNSTGVMWWCAHDQNHLTNYPYRTDVLERKLGLLRNEYEPKPVALEMKKFSDFVYNLDFDLPEAKKDAVCILSEDQEQCSIAHITHLLMRRSGLNPRFALNEVPDSDLYIVPSVKTFFDKPTTAQLYEKVQKGADLYISADKVYIDDFEKITGLDLVDSCDTPEERSFCLDGHEFTYTTGRTNVLRPITAEVIAADNKGNPTITVNKYGKGNVYYINFPLENLLMEDPGKEEYKLIYQKLFGKKAVGYPISSPCDDVFITTHCDGNTVYSVAVNHTDKPQTIVADNESYTIEKIYHGNENTVEPFDAAVIKFIKK